MKNNQKGKDYYVGTYPYKKPRKVRTGKICPICKSCKDKSLCKSRKDTKMMKKCPECKECFDKEHCDVFYIGNENKVTAIVGIDENGKPIRKTFNGASPEEASYRAVKYKLDVKTLLGVVLNNFGFGDFSVLFKYYIYKIPPHYEREKEVTSDVIDKKNTLNKYFNNIKKIFRCFINNKTGLTIIINDLKEMKDFYIIYGLYNQLENGPWVKEELKFNKNR